MNELPKSVREHMAREQTKSGHLDADLLNGFGENTLSAAERKRVLEHVAHCSECREIVFLAAPHTEPAQTVLSPVRSRRFVWMAWASVAAVLIVVGSVVMLQKQNLKNPELSPKPVTTAEVKPPALPEEKEAPPSPTVSPKVSTDKKGPLFFAKSAPKAAPATASSRNDSIVDSTLLTEQTENAPPIMVAKPRGVVAGAIATEPAPPQPSSAPAAYGGLVAKNQATPPLPGHARQEVMQKSSVDATRAFSAPLADAQLATRTHWRLSQSGTLERSFGGESPWSSVLSGKKFRVVSVMGPIVWAGGYGGALYVSRDAGESWTQVSLGTTATITSIHFRDEKNGTIQTTDALWNTSDGGRSWKKE